MRTAQLLAALALAAASASVMARADCHVGLVGALGLGSTQHVDVGNSFDLTGSFDVNGGMGGGIAGCRWPVGGGWLGFEADYSAANVEGTIGQLPPNVGFTSSTRVNSLATLRVVAGGNVTTNWGIFGSLGLAAAPTKVTTCNAAGTCGSDNQTMVGFAGGVSSEYAFTRSLRLRLEYLYAGFETKPFTPSGGLFLQRNVDLGMSLLRVGVDLHF